MLAFHLLREVRSKVVVFPGGFGRHLARHSGDAEQEVAQELDRALRNIES